MAVTVLQQPTSPNVAGTELVYTLSSSLVNEPQFRYVVDVYESGSNDFITRLRTYPNVYGTTNLNLSRTLQDQLEYDIYTSDVDFFNPFVNQTIWELTGSYVHTDSVKKYNLKFGEEYGTSLSSSLTVYTGSTEYPITVFAGAQDINGGDWNFDTSSFDSRNPILTDCPSSYDFYSQPSVFKGDPVIYLNTEDNHTITFLKELSGEVVIDLNYESPQGVITNFTSSVISHGSEEFTSFGVGPLNLINNFPDLGQYITGSNVNRVDIKPDTGVGGFTYYIANKNAPYAPCNADEALLDPNAPFSSERPDPYTRFAFINKYGFFDYYNVYNPLKRATQVQRNTSSRTFVRYEDYLPSYRSNYRGEKQYDVEVNDTFEITTDFLDKRTADWLIQLIESPYVYVTIGDFDTFGSSTLESDFTGIDLVNVDYNVAQGNNRNKLFQYTIQFQLSKRRWNTGVFYN